MQALLTRGVTGSLAVALAATGLLVAELAVGFPAARAGPAVNQFETKDLETSPGEMQFQSQNALAFGQPKRRVREDQPGMLTYDDNTVARERYALEMQMGITTWFRARLGIEFEKERLDDPVSPAHANAFEDLQLTGVALEGVFVAIPVKTYGVGLGLLTEYDASIRGGLNQLYIGPIIQAVSGPWSATANLLLVQNFGSPDKRHELPADRKRDFAYALQLQYEVSPTWALALEGYGTFDRIGGSGTQSAEQAAFGTFDQHRAGPVVYYRFKADSGGRGGKASGGQPGLVKSVRKDDDDGPGGGLENGGKDDDDDKKGTTSLGVGLLFGLNANTPSETVKVSVEVNF